jgi:hypothetical protein
MYFDEVQHGINSNNKKYLLDVIIRIHESLKILFSIKKAKISVLDFEKNYFVSWSLLECFGEK